MPHVGVKNTFLGAFWLKLDFSAFGSYADLQPALNPEMNREKNGLIL